MQVIKKIVIRAILYPLVLLLLLLGGITIALRIPAVQTQVVQYAAEKVSAMLHFPIHIRSVDIKWFDTVRLKGVQIFDQAENAMFDVGELDVNFALNSLLDTANVNIDVATLRNARVRLIVDKRTGDLNVDEFIAAINELTASKDTSAAHRNSPSVPFTIDRVTLENTTFSYSDDREDSLGKNEFDYYHFTFDSLYTSAERFKINADTIEVSFDGLRGTERLSRLRIHELNTDFRYTKRNMTFGNLFARIGKSVLRRHLVFNYPKGTSDFDDFNHNVRMEAELDSALVYSKDLALFAPELYAYEEMWSVSGRFKGTVDNFNVKNTDFYFGRRSHLHGTIRFEGLPNLRETFVNLNLEPSTIHAEDTRQYMDEASYRIAQKFGRVALQGKFLGFSRDFVANGTFETALGNLVSDLNFKIKPGKGESIYKGKLITRGFDLGKLVDEPGILQKIDIAGQVVGQGLTLDDAVLSMKAKAAQLGLYGYNYQNLEVDGDLNRGLFSGSLSVKDPNLDFQVSGEVNLKDDEHVDLEGRIGKANFKTLKLTPADISLQTDFSVHFQGLDLDRVAGGADFLNSTLVYNSRGLNLDTLSLFSQQDGDQRIFDLNSDLADIRIEGNYTFSRAAQDLQQLFHEYELYFFRSDKEKNDYYQEKRKKRLTSQVGKYSVNYQFQLKDINPVIGLFDPGVYVSRNTRLEGVFTSGTTSIFSFNSQIDTLAYKSYRFYGSAVDLSTSKLADSASVLASVFISSRNQKMNGFAATENIAVEGVWNQDRIDFTGRIRQTKSTNRADLTGDLRFVPDGFLIEFQPSHFYLLDKDWRFARNNSITIIGSEITFNNVSLANQTQVLSISGVVSPDPSKTAEVQITDFDLTTLGPLIGRNLRGTLNGFLNVRDVYDTIHVNSEASIGELVIDKFLIGDVSTDVKWAEADKLLHVGAQIDRMGRQIVSLSGTYDPNRDDRSHSLNLLAELKQTDLEILEPFVSSFFSNIGGTASGKVRITGRLSAPVLKGELAIRRGRIRYNYLNTNFHFEDNIFFTENQIGTHQLRLTDDEGHMATLQGGVYHDSFRAFVLDLKASLNNFKILNTDSKNGELYYGTAYASGTVSIFGPFDNLTVQADARSNPGTKIYIPLDRTQTVEQEEYIQFASHRRADSTLAATNEVKKIRLSGVKLEFNLELTPDAYCELIFDKQSGDIIKANGSGKIKLQIDTNGEFTMLGNYEITSGTYNFTFLNVVNKQFNIKPNSRITWTGDPYDALLNINAAYIQYASLAPILAQGSYSGASGLQSQSDPNRRYPVSVLMNLTGNLMTPKIDLGIEINDYPKDGNYVSAVTAFQSRIQSNEQELNQQVFSLMILRQLWNNNTYGTTTVSDNTGQRALGSSVSELLSNQFSSWISQVDQNLQVDFNLNGLDQNAINNLQMRLSYAFLNGRLRLTRNGSFTNANNTSDVRSVLGEWTVEYWLTRDGKYRMKVYNRNNQNILSSSVDNNTITSTSTGFSVMHTQSFDNFAELIRRKKKKKMRKIEIPLEPEEITQPGDKASSPAAETTRPKEPDADKLPNN